MNEPTGRLVRWKDTLVALQTGFTLVQQAYHSAVGKIEGMTYTIEIEDNDPIFSEVQAWLLDAIPPTRRRALRAFTRRGRDNGEVIEAEVVNRTAPEWELLIENIGSRPHDVVIAGHSIKVTYVEPDQEAKAQKTEEKTIYFLDRAKIQFSSRTPAGRNAAIELLGQLTERYDVRVSNVPRVFRAASWGGWRLHAAPPRAIETVVLAGDMRERLEADLRSFLASEQRYADLGIPWHRGYLLHGPPGTGKTSIVRALAAHLRLDLFYISLADIDKDVDLANTLGQLAPKSMLLIEDVDVAHGAKERDDRDRGVSLTGLLNVLDGVLTPHGLVKMLTTNNVDALDPAVVRPGRADVIEHVDYLQDDQLARLVRVLVPEAVESHAMPSVAGQQLTAAEVVEVIKLNMHGDPDEIVRLVVKMIEERERH